MSVFEITLNEIQYESSLQPLKMSKTKSPLFNDPVNRGNTIGEFLFKDIIAARSQFGDSSDLSLVWSDR